MEKEQGRQSRKRELATVSFFLAVIVALMGISAVPAHGPAQEVEATPPAAALEAAPVAAASLDDAAVQDGEVQMYY